MTETPPRSDVEISELAKPDAAELDAGQRDYWNGPATRTWLGRRQQMDRALAPVLRALIEHAAPQPDERVLDIGCGTGESVVALAEAVGPRGHVTAVDISAPLLDVVRARLAEHGANTDLILGDAAAHDYGGRRYDLLFSRFGVMFFGDPVAAFAHLRGAMAPDGRLVFACWQPQAANPWMRDPQNAILPLLPPLPPTDPHLPGQFAFGDANRVAEILTAAGFAPAAFTPFAFPMLLGPTLEEAVQSSSGFGATGRMLAEQPEHVRAAALETLRALLSPYVGADGMVAMPGRIWLAATRVA